MAGPSITNFSHHSNTVSENNPNKPETNVTVATDLKNYFSKDVFVTIAGVAGGMAVTAAAGTLAVILLMPAGVVGSIVGALLMSAGGVFAGDAATYCLDSQKDNNSLLGSFLKKNNPDCDSINELLALYGEQIIMGAVSSLGTGFLGGRLSATAARWVSSEGVKKELGLGFKWLAHKMSGNTSFVGQTNEEIKTDLSSLFLEKLGPLGKALAKFLEIAQADNASSPSYQGFPARTGIRAGAGIAGGVGGSDGDHAQLVTPSFIPSNVEVLQPMTDEDRVFVNDLYARYPALQQALDANQWSEEQKRDVLRAANSVIYEHTADSTYESLSNLAIKMNSFVWSRDQKFGFIKATIKRYEHGLYNACLEISKIFVLMQDSGWSPRQQTDLIMTMAKDASIDYGKFYECLLAIQGISCSVDQKHDLFSSIVQRQGAYHKISRILSIVNFVESDSDKKITVLKGIVEKSGDTHNFFVQPFEVLGGMSSVDFSDEKPYNLLNALYRNVGVNADGTYEKNLENLALMNSLGWSRDRQYKLLMDIAEKGREGALYISGRLPAVLGKMKSDGWNCDQQYRDLTHIVTRFGGRVRNLYSAMDKLLVLGADYDPQQFEEYCLELESEVSFLDGAVTGDENGPLREMRVRVGDLISKLDRSVLSGSYRSSRHFAGHNLEVFASQNPQFAPHSIDALMCSMEVAPNYVLSSLGLPRLDLYSGIHPDHAGVDYQSHPLYAEFLGSLLSINPGCAPLLLKRVFDLINVVFDPVSRSERQYAGLAVLAHTIKKVPSVLSLDYLMRVGECDLTPVNRSVLAMQVIAPYLSRYPKELTPQVFQRVCDTVRSAPDYKYFINFLQYHSGLASEVIGLADTEMETLEKNGAFEFKKRAKEILSNGPKEVLIVQDINNDGIGCYINRIGFLMQGLLKNPDLKITLIASTSWPDLYKHERITVIKKEALVKREYDAVFEFRKWPSKDKSIETSSLLYLQGGIHFPTYIETPTGKVNGVGIRFGFGDMQIDDKTYDMTGLNLHAEDVYGSGMRMACELGLPISPLSKRENVLAGVDTPESIDAWNEVVQGNSENRPVMLFNAFGGVYREKGFYDRDDDLPHSFSHDSLRSMIQKCVEKGYYVVLMPGGNPILIEHYNKVGSGVWGSNAIANSIILSLPEAIRQQIVVAPDLALLPSGAVSHFVKVADRRLTIEGTVHHTAQMFTEPVDVLLTCHNNSGDESWVPNLSRARIITGLNLDYEIPNART